MAMQYVQHVSELALDCGLMSTRWSITTAPEHWTVANVEQWFTVRKFASITGVVRRGKHDWVARAWSPDNGAVIA